MNGDRGARLMTLFQEATALDPAARGAYLDAACADDPELRSQVERMLVADGAVCPWLDDDAAVAAAAAARAASALDLAGAGPDLPAAEPTMPGNIAGFRIVRELGRGGMGVVYEAEEQHPHRRVALKLLRAGAVSDDLRARFEREVNLLARLDHPGIARVFEAGLDGDGAAAIPYYAMEYVEDATRIDAFADEHALSRAERVDLMAAVCDAVHHGHENGVIHRDLKPANVIVGTDGQPKVIDFGIARSFDTEDPDETVHTSAGQIMGTLSSMSPEQCSGDARAIDRRTDVYALGVMLYELLCGTMPIETSGLPVATALRRIAEVEPVPLGRHDPALRGDLETIASVALEKDPERRYPSAAALGEDLRRHRRGEPITTRASSTLYVLRRRLMRRRAALGVAAAFLVLLIGGSVYLSALGREQTRIRGQVAAITQFLETTPDHRDPLEFLDELFVELLGIEAVTDPFGAQGPEEERIRQISDWLDTTAPALPPADEARVCTALGYAWNRLERHARAAPRFERALALRRALGANQALLATDLIGLARARANLHELAAAEALYREALELRRLDADGPDAAVAEALNGLGGCLKRAGRFDEAEGYYLQAIDMRRAVGAGVGPIAATLNNLATLYQLQGKHTEARRGLSEALVLITGVEINELYRMRSSRSLALCSLYAGEGGDGLDMLLTVRDRVDGLVRPGDPDWVGVRTDIAEALVHLGRPAEALREIDRLLATPARAGLELHLAHALALRAAARRAIGETDVAIDLDRAGALARPRLPAEHPFLNLIAARANETRTVRAAAERLAEQVGVEHPWRQEAEIHLARLSGQRDRVDALRAAIEAEGRWAHPRLLEVQAELNPDTQSAQLLWEAAAAALSAWYGPDHPASIRASLAAHPPTTP